MTEKPHGYHEHHRQLRRGGDERPVNKLYIGPDMHSWIHSNPEGARELGWLVSQYEDPEDVIVVIPDKLPAKVRKPKATTPEERKARVNFTIKTPKDEEMVIPELVESLREKWAAEMGWKKDVPSYYVVVAALSKALLDS